MAGEPNYLDNTPVSYWLKAAGGGIVSSWQRAWLSSRKSPWVWRYSDWHQEVILPIRRTLNNGLSPMEVFGFLEVNVFLTDFDFFF